MLELLQHQLTLTLERLGFYLAAFWIKRRQPGQIDEAVGNGDGVRHSAFAIALYMCRKLQRYSGSKRALIAANQSANFSFRAACTEGGFLSRHPKTAASPSAVTGLS